MLRRQEAVLTMEVEHARASRGAGTLDAFTVTRMETQVAEYAKQRQLVEEELGIVRRALTEGRSRG